MEYTEKYYGRRIFYIPGTYDLDIIKEQRGYDKLFDGIEADTFFELGGNKGYTSVYAMTKGIKRIFSFEPEPVNARYFRANTNDCDVTLYEAMADVADGFADFYVNSGINKGLHSRVKRKGREIIQVPTVNFWPILENSGAQLLKIDIEGGEYFLDLENRKIPDCVKRIAIEIDWKGWGKLEDPKAGRPYALYKAIRDQFPKVLKDTSKDWTQFNWSIVYIGER